MNPRDEIDPGEWEPLSVAQTAAVLAGLDARWWIAGGWAIDLFLGRQSRDHADLDVVVLHSQQAQVWRHLSDAGWELWAAEPHGRLRRLKPREIVVEPTHDVWCRPNGQSHWALQVMLVPSIGDRWIYRRNPAVALALNEIGCRTLDGVPYLAPQVQLLFKSKSPRPKDEADFTLAVAELSTDAQRWLASAIRSSSPAHPWLATLPS
jgi:hypothetical protein